MVDQEVVRQSLGLHGLVRLFKRHTGQSPMAWLAKRRAEKAAVLLLTTDKAICDRS